MKWLRILASFPLVNMLWVLMWFPVTFTLYFIIAIWEKYSNETKF